MLIGNGKLRAMACVIQVRCSRMARAGNASGAHFALHATEMMMMMMMNVWPMRHGMATARGSVQFLSDTIINIRSFLNLSRRVEKTVRCGARCVVVELCAGVHSNRQTGNALEHYIVIVVCC